MGEVRLDGGKIERMGFCIPPTDENRITRKTVDENYSNGGEFWYGSSDFSGYLRNIG